MGRNINHLMAKVLSREASSEEIIRFSQWLSEEADGPDEFRKLKSYWDAEVSFKQTLTPELSLRKMRQKLKRQKKKRMFYTLSVAASLFLLTGTGVFMISRKGNAKNLPVQYFTYLTGDHKTSFTLTDGTKIQLNKNGKLVYTDRYGKPDRYVRLEGEAFFDVPYDPKSPFVVELGDAQINVLGTSFNVRIDEQANVHTTLVEGSIRFEAPDQQVVLSPDQQLVYTHAANRIEIHSINIEEELAWMEGIIRHRSVSFVDLIDGLKQRFHVRIIVRNEQLKKSSVSMTGAFPEDQSLEEILKIIAITYPFTWEKKDNIYYID